MQLRAIAAWRPHRPAYYGWYIVGAALVAQFVSAGLQAYSIGAFLTPMTSDLGWNREDFANAQTIGTVVMGFAGLVIGGQIDRRGARPLMLIGAAVAGLSLIGLSRVQTLWQFYLLRGIAFTLGNACLGNLVVNVTVAKWFVRQRGMAVALASAGVSLGGVILAPVSVVLVDSLGWRGAWVAMGLLCWALITPSAFVMRRTPEDYGLRPDGDPPDYVAKPNRLGVTDTSWTRREAMHTRAIWLLILAFGVGNIGLNAMLFHMIPFLTDNGFSRGMAAFMFSAEAWAALMSKPLWGALLDRIQPRYLSAVAFLISAVAVAGLLLAAGATAMLPVLAMLLLWGVSVGGVIPLQETVWAGYFGRAHLGKIRAVAMPFTIVFSAIGPKLAGALYDRTGSYVAAYLIFAGTWALGAGLILLARAPRRPVGAGAGEQSAVATPAVQST